MTYSPPPGDGFQHPGVPGQPQAGGVPNWAAPVPPKKRKKWPFVLGGVVLLIVIIGIASGGEESTNDSAPTSATRSAPEVVEKAEATEVTVPEEEAKAVGLNAPARDGKFEFVVTGFEAGVTTVGDNPYFTEDASGHFVIVSVTVTNISDKAQPFSPGNQKLIDAQGREFEPDTTAMIAASSSDIPVWDKINPGITANIQLVYDVALDASPAKVELHDSMFSGGVDVKLS